MIVQGAKNAALPVFAAALLTEEPVVIHNWPAISDVYYMLSILEHIGAHVAYEKDKVSNRYPARDALGDARQACQGDSLLDIHDGPDTRKVPHGALYVSGRMRDRVAAHRFAPEGA